MLGILLHLMKTVQGWLGPMRTMVPSPAGSTGPLPCHREFVLVSCYRHPGRPCILTNLLKGQLFQGRLDIINALCALETLKFCTRGSADVQYDVVYLGVPTGVLLIVASTLKDAKSEGSARCSWSFVLKKNQARPSGGWVLYCL